MSIVSSQERINRANLGLLRGKTYFREIAKPKAKKCASKIDGQHLKRKVILLANRKASHKLRVALILSLIYLIFTLSVAVLR